MKKKHPLAFLLLFSLIISICLGGCTTAETEGIEKTQPTASINGAFPSDGITDSAKEDVGTYKEKFIESASIFGLSFDLTIDNFIEKYNQAVRDTENSINVLYERTEYETFSLPYFHKEDFWRYNELPNGMTVYSVTNIGGDAPIFAIYTFDGYIVGAYVKGNPAPRDAGSNEVYLGWVGAAVRLLMVLDDCTFDEAFTHLAQMTARDTVEGEYDQGQLDISEYIVTPDGPSNKYYRVGLFYGEFATTTPISGGLTGIFELTGEMENYGEFTTEAPIVAGIDFDVLKMRPDPPGLKIGYISPVNSTDKFGIGNGYATVDNDTEQIVISGNVSKHTGKGVILTANGKEVAYEKHTGNFELQVDLAEGENVFEFVAENAMGDAAGETITIIRGDANKKPQSVGLTGEESKRPDISNMQYDGYLEMYYDTDSGLYYAPDIDMYGEQIELNKYRGLVIDCALAEVEKALDTDFVMAGADWEEPQVLDRDAFGRYLVYLPITFEGDNLYYISVVYDVKVTGNNHETIEYKHSKDSSTLEIGVGTDTGVPAVITNYRNGIVEQVIAKFLENNKWDKENT